MKYSNFEELPLWQKSRKLVNDIYNTTLTEPFPNDFRFRDQIRSSSGSIMDNIAEGFERSGNKECIQHLIYCQKKLQKNKITSLQSI